MGEKPICSVLTKLPIPLICLPAANRTCSVLVFELTEWSDVDQSRGFCDERLHLLVSRRRHVDQLRRQLQVVHQRRHQALLMTWTRLEHIKLIINAKVKPND